MVDLWRDFWLRETGTGQQVAQLHDRYMMMMMMISICHQNPWKLIVGKNVDKKSAQNSAKITLLQKYLFSSVT